MGACAQHAKNSTVCPFVCALLFVVFALFFPVLSYADETVAAQGDLYLNTDEVSIEGVSVSAGGDSASIDGIGFAVHNFSRAQKGSNLDRGGSYIGYNYYQGSTADYSVAVAAQDFVLVYVPNAEGQLCDIAEKDSQTALKAFFLALDTASLSGGVVMSDEVPWYFTDASSVVVEGIRYNFAVEADPSKFYVSLIGEDGSDVSASVTDGGAKPSHVDFLQIAQPSNVDVVQPSTGIDAFTQFIGGVDYSPLWVTLRTTLVAIVVVFILGLFAAYFCLRIPKRAQDIADTIFTIPMVLPPTVCGFLLLLAFGNSTSFGRFLKSIGLNLTFSWEATVIAAVVVSFPLMYRSARGAFENLDSNMLDAARTLGWSNWAIFLRLMLPLSWSSIAAGTVLAFARALGEFGATLFLAGNYVGITRTIPIAIYFEWMSGNTDVALFWTVIIIIFSFIVILFINLWSRRTTKYRLASDE